MNTQDFVEDYVKSYKSRFLKLFIIQSIIDIILIALFILAVIKFIDKSYIYICLAVFIVLQQASFYINMRKFLGGFKGFSKDSKIEKSYKDAVKQFNKTGNKTLLDEKLSELEMLIKENQ